MYVCLFVWLFDCLIVWLFYFYFIFHLLLGTGAPHKCGTIRSSQSVADISEAAANITYPAVYHGGCWVIKHYVSDLAVANPTPRAAAISGSKVGSRFCATGHVHILTPACDFHFLRRIERTRFIISRTSLAWLSLCYTFHICNIAGMPIGWKCVDGDWIVHS